MKRHRLQAYLDYIEEEAAVVRKAIQGLDVDVFQRDPLVSRAVERSIETIGEAVSKVRPDLEPMAPDLPWREIVRMRNILAHMYWKIDSEIVWETATVHLPTLAERLAILRDEL